MEHLTLHDLTSHSATTEELLKPERVLQSGNVGDEVAYGTQTQPPHPENFGSIIRSLREGPDGRGAAVGQLWGSCGAEGPAGRGPAPPGCGSAPRGPGTERRRASLSLNKSRAMGAPSSGLKNEKPA